MGWEAGDPGTVVLGAEDRARGVAAARALLRVGMADDDALMGVLVETALGVAERFTGQVLIARAMTEMVRARGCWQPLAARPVRAITEVTGVDADGSAAVLAPADHAIDIDPDGVGWVCANRVDAGRLTVALTAGLAEDWDTLPRPIAQGSAMLAAFLFGDTAAKAVPPAAITALWRPFRVIRLTADAHA